METLTIKEAAEIMNASPQFIRCGLEQGIFPFGYAVKMSKRYTYWISKDKLEESIGIKKNAEV